MKIITSVQEMATTAEQWSFSPAVALVPTMGYLHEGHLSLIREAKNLADQVIVSIFVNPLQFGPAEDFERYPRDTERDSELLRQLDVDYLFSPSASEMTPPEMIFSLDPGQMGTVLCGKYRPGHFAGVATIVSKLFNVVRPGVAIFGWKDAQQFLILQKMAADLSIPVHLIPIETMRDNDGLALSSRNVYLTPAQRAAAPAINRSLIALKQVVVENPEVTADTLKEHFERLIADEPELRLQYIEVVSQDTLKPLPQVIPGNTLIATAVHAGQTRLIDNVRL